MKTKLLILIFPSLAFISRGSELPLREDTRLDASWRFKSGDDAGAAQATFDDAGWQTITLPHNWGFEEAQQGQKFYRGPGWYRRALDIGVPKAGRRYYLRFEAASTVADVYLNGALLGQHRGGFGAFCFDITNSLAATGTNTLAVRVSNALEPDVAPLDGDFSVYGGLYRPVHLIVADEVSFTLTDHASPGVAWLQTNVSESEAQIDVVAQISNPTGKDQSRTFVARVLDASGQAVASGGQNLTIPKNCTVPSTLRIAIKQPHLWNGRADPYLYKAVAELRDADVATDSVEQPLGLRFYHVDPDKGFFLNDKAYHLHGVDRHQDRWNKGWAITEADMEEDANLVYELGCTVIRCAHYQHSDYFYSLCDKKGILVWAEIPQVNTIHAGAAFAETSRSQLLDLIRQNVNHPAIFVWSLFNEIRYGTPDPHRLLQDLKVVANGEDPTRPTIAATCISNLPQMNKIPDLLGWNIYPGWYRETKEDYGRDLDARRNDSRDGGICISEYGAGANVTQHEQNPVQPKTTGQWHPEEWQAEVHESAWEAMKTRPFIWGTFVWNMFDFTVDKRHEGGVPGRNDKGLVTTDRKIKKDAFFFYKANWSDEPVLYIASRRFTERTDPNTGIKIYSNANNVKLTVNGVSKGAQTAERNGTFVWKDIALAPGENHIEVQAERAGKKLTDDCVWTLKPAAKPAATAPQ